jgi:hypothetical protein
VVRIENVKDIMRASNWLANIFNFFGDALERFNPAAFRFLSASLPYLTPVPVAWLTSQSAATFLHFNPQVAFIFVFSLEGIGLWFTSLLVDSVVDWVRSKNWKSFVPVVMFAIAVVAYVYLLVNLNVTLESASGNSSPVLSKVITLMCFLPLITGIGNGYYKLKLDYKTDLEQSKRHNEEMELLKLQEANKLKLDKFRIKYETSENRNGTSKSTSGSDMEVPKHNGSSETTSGSKGRPSIHQDRVFSYLEENYKRRGVVPTFTEVMRDLKNIPESTASRLRNKWLGK